MVPAKLRSRVTFRAGESAALAEAEIESKRLNRVNVLVFMIVSISSVAQGSPMLSFVHQDWQ
jgi:hypothetical protein